MEGGDKLLSLRGYVWSIYVEIIRAFARIFIPEGSLFYVRRKLFNTIKLHIIIEKMVKFYRKKQKLFLRARQSLVAITALMVLMLFSSCNDSQIIDWDLSEGEGVISLNIVTIDATVSEASTRLSVDDLKVRIENTVGDILREWDSVSDVPETIAVVEGSYKIVAYSGDESLLPSFTEEYYTGESKFAVTEGEKVDVNLTVKHGETKVLVNFDTESFDKCYSSYSIDVRTTTTDNTDTDYLNYTAQTTDEGNFLPGTLRMRLRLVPIGEAQEYYFYPTAIEGLGAAERREVNLAVNSTSGDASLEITTDDGYSYTEQIDLELPGSILPQAAPTLTANNFTVGGIIEGNQCESAEDKYSATILATAGIKSVVVRTTTQSVIEKWGGKSELEFVDATTEVQNLLTETGFRWDSAIASSQTANVKYGRVNVSFGDMFASLECEDGAEYSDYSFEIEVLDMYDQSNKNSSNDEGKFYYTVRVFPPLFGWSSEPSAGNVWSSHAEFDIFSTTTTPEKPSVWIKSSDEVYREASTQSFEQLDDQEDGTGIQYVYGLSSNTQYTFKLMLGGHSSSEFTFTTEEIPSEIENGDMEDWYAVQLGTSLHDIPYYTPYLNGGNQYWTTNNDRTTAYQQWLCTYSYNCFPTVSYTLMAYEGTYAAEVRSISASDVHVLNTTSITYDHSKREGRLFIGSYSWSSSTETIDLGKSFDSRPTSFSFYYTYTPYDSDESFTADIVLYSGSDEIGTGSFVSAAGVTTSNYEKQVVEIEYTDRRVRADKMAITFLSTNQSPAPVRKTTYTVDFVGNEEDNEDWGIWLGAILRVDNVELQY